MNTTDEETGKWVIVHYFPHEPVQLYGFFDTDAEAFAYAEKQMPGWGDGQGAYTVQMVLNAHMTYQWRREPWE